MANGAAVAKLVPPSAPATPSTGQEDIRTTIGTAVARAATGLCYAVQEYQNGGLTNTTRTVNGERIAALYWLQQAHGGKIDFPAVAREQGKVVLRQYLRDDFYQQYSTEQGDAVLDMFIDETLAVLARVTAAERAWAN